MLCRKPNPNYLTQPKDGASQGEAVLMARESLLKAARPVLSILIKSFEHDQLDPVCQC